MRTLFLWTTTLAAWGLSAPALAQDIDGSLQVEFGRMDNDDPGFDVFSNRNRMPSWGVRGGISIGDNLSVIGGWHRVRRGSEAELYWGSSTSETIAAAYFADQFTLGPKVGLRVGEIFYPYASVEGLLYRSTLRFDDDTTTKSNLGQITSAGMAPGIIAMGGSEFRSPTGIVGLMIVFNAELGYSWVGSVNYGEVGDIKPGGLVFRMGAGIRF